MAQESPKEDPKDTTAAADTSADEDGISTPAKTDVLLGRGAKMWSHEGNRKFRDIVSGYLKTYEQAKLRIEKTMIVTDILKKVQEDGGRFVKLDPTTNTWREVDKRTAIEKIGHAIRDRKALAQKKEYQKTVAQDYLNQRRVGPSFPSSNAAVSMPGGAGAGTGGFDPRLLPPESAALLTQKVMMMEKQRLAAAAAAAANPNAAAFHNLLGAKNAREAFLASQMNPALFQQQQQQQQQQHHHHHQQQQQAALLASSRGMPPTPTPPQGPSSSSSSNAPSSMALQHMLLMEEANRNLMAAKEAMVSFRNTQNALQNLKGMPGLSQQQQQQQQNQQQQPQNLQQQQQQHNNNAALLALQKQQLQQQQGKVDASLMTLASLSSQKQAEASKNLAARHFEL